MLERIFDVITSKISELEQSQIKNYARTMVGIKLSLQIEKWIAENHLTQQNYTDEQLVKMLISFFQETHTLKKEIDCFADICQMWLEGCSFVEMHERISLPIADLEDILRVIVSAKLRNQLSDRNPLRAVQFSLCHNAYLSGALLCRPLEIPVVSVTFLDCERASAIEFRFFCFGSW